MRLLIEKFARNKVVKRKLPKMFGSTLLYLSPDSQLKYFKFGEKAFDKELLRIAFTHIKKDFIVWDVGANVGVFSFAAASLVENGEVIAIEPDVWMVDLMKKSQQHKNNSALNIRILPAAISNVCGVAEFLISSRGRARNALKMSNGRGVIDFPRAQALVPTITLDKLLDFLPPPNFIKIDVEGAEKMVLEGGGKLLRDVRPIIYIEVGPETSADITAIFYANNYKIFDENEEVITLCTFNTLAVPCEKI